MIESKTISKPQLDEFELIAELGRGLNAKVYKGQNSKGDVFAIKRLKDLTSSNIEAICTEFEVLRKIQHENIIKLYRFREGVLRKPNGAKKSNIPYACIELAPNGEIFHYILSFGRFTEPIARYYFKSLINGLEHCHKQGYAHRDIKLQNILLDSMFTLKLADFGFAAALAGKDFSGKLHTTLGTKSYMAPEIHMEKAYSGISVDLFAAAVVLFIMITGHPPFDKADPTDPYYMLIFSNKNQKFWNSHSRSKAEGFFSAEFISLMDRMLAFDPAKRPTISQIKSDPWYVGPTAPIETVIDFMSKRKHKVDEDIKQEKVKAQILKKMLQAATAQGGQTRMGYRSVDDFIQLDVLDSIQVNGSQLSTVKIQALEEFSKFERVLHTCQNFTFDDVSKSIVTILDPLDIIDMVCKHYAIKNDNEKMEGVIFDEKQYKVKGLNYKEKIDETSEMNCPKSVDISFKISKLEEELNVVQFYKNTGDDILFYQIIEELREIFYQVSSNFVQKVEKSQEEQLNN